MLRVVFAVVFGVVFGVVFDVVSGVVTGVVPGVFGVASGVVTGVVATVATVAAGTATGFVATVTGAVAVVVGVVVGTVMWSTVVAVAELGVSGTAAGRPPRWAEEPVSRASATVRPAPPKAAVLARTAIAIERLRTVVTSGSWTFGEDTPPSRGRLGVPGPT